MSIQGSHVYLQARKMCNIWPYKRNVVLPVDAASGPLLHAWQVEKKPPQEASAGSGPIAASTSSQSRARLRPSPSLSGQPSSVVSAALHSKAFGSNPVLCPCSPGAQVGASSSPPLLSPPSPEAGSATSAASADNGVGAVGELAKGSPEHVRDGPHMYLGRKPCFPKAQVLQAERMRRTMSSPTPPPARSSSADVSPSWMRRCWRKRSMRLRSLSAWLI
mmetsp:Transcript_93518/g.238056  ORF Transcript_93518/g.238056 Transcript_93518/m.238056 type:complete len:219 (-) Transcript_93518:338-994(-)